METKIKPVIRMCEVTEFKPTKSCKDIWDETATGKNHTTLPNLPLKRLAAWLGQKYRIVYILLIAVWVAILPVLYDILREIYLVVFCN